MSRIAFIDPITGKPAAVKPCRAKRVAMIARLITHAECLTEPSVDMIIESILSDQRGLYVLNGMKAGEAAKTIKSLKDTVGDTYGRYSLAYQTLCLLMLWCKEIPQTVIRVN